MCTDACVYVFAAVDVVYMLYGGQGSCSSLGLSLFFRNLDVLSPQRLSARPRAQGPGPQAAPAELTSDPGGSFCRGWGSQDTRLLAPWGSRCWGCLGEEVEASLALAPQQCGQSTGFECSLARATFPASDDLLGPQLPPLQSSQRNTHLTDGRGRTSLVDSCGPLAPLFSLPKPFGLWDSNQNPRASGLWG